MEDLLSKVKQHHFIVKKHLPETSPVMTVLIGSNNYELDTPESDVDTFTFVFPSFKDMAFARDPISGEVEVSDGKCMYKDIRLALNLLKKTSPNSLECFVSKYRYYEPKYANILTKYLDNENTLNKMSHCNYEHMLYAMAGMAHQLTKRNMPAGKRYSHALRLYSMKDNFLNFADTFQLLTLLPRDYQEALHAKRDTMESHDAYYNDGCVSIANILDECRNKFKKTPIQHAIEVEGLKLIEEMQQELMHYYIKYIL